MSRILRFRALAQTSTASGSISDDEQCLLPQQGSSEKFGIFAVDTNGSSLRLQSVGQPCSVIDTIHSSGYDFTYLHP